MYLTLSNMYGARVALVALAGVYKRESKIKYSTFTSVSE